MIRLSQPTRARASAFFFSFVLACGLANGQATPAPGPVAVVTSLTAFKAGHKTKLLKEEKIGEAAPEPPKGVFEQVKFTAPLGEMDAYVSPDPGDGKKHPLIVWRVGGFANSIGGTEWEEAEPDNDQSGSQYRKAGVLMMYPSLRGGNMNPGAIEGCYGEVEDVLAAAAYAAKLPYVDPAQIYLGGHSVGGTLALLVAAMEERPFRAIIALGAADSFARYGEDNAPFDIKDQTEVNGRSPIRYLNTIQTETWVIEGLKGNVTALYAMRAQCKNPKVHFHQVPGTHFTILARLNAAIAAQIMAAAGGGTTSFTLDQKILNAALRGDGEGVGAKK